MRAKYILDVFYSIFIFLLSVFFKNSKVWLFGAQGGLSYSDNSKYFFEWLLKEHPDEECYWITKDKRIYRNLKNKKVPVVFFYSFKSILFIAKAKYLVCTHSHTGNDVYKFVKKSKVLITLWHGIPLKKMGKLQKKSYREILPIKNEPDVFLVTSDRDADLFSEIYNISRSKFLIGSYPRVNDLIDRAEEKRIILYAPTFRDGMDQEYYDNNVFPSASELIDLNNILVSFDYRFVIKLHPYMNARFPDLTDLSNIVILEAWQDIQDVLCKAEILITDYSSVYFDYLNLDREVVFYIPDYQWYSKKENRGFIYKYDDVTPGEKLKRWVDLNSYLSSRFVSSRSDFDTYSEGRKEILDFFYTARELDNSDLLYECKKIHNFT